MQFGNTDLPSSRQRTLSAARDVAVVCDDGVTHGGCGALHRKSHLLLLRKMGAAVRGGSFVRRPELVSRLAAAGGQCALKPGSTGRAAACPAIRALGVLLERTESAEKRWRWKSRLTFRAPWAASSDICIWLLSNTLDRMQLAMCVIVVAGFACYPPGSLVVRLETLRVDPSLRNGAWDPGALSSGS